MLLRHSVDDDLVEKLKMLGMIFFFNLEKLRPYLAIDKVSINWLLVTR